MHMCMLGLLGDISGTPSLFYALDIYDLKCVIIAL